MFTIAGIGFTSAWLLLGLLALPLLWILLRAIPPAPVRRLFPGVALLLGLSDDESQADKTPWWLLLLRTLAIAAAIVGFAGPVLNPKDADTGRGPLLILVDGTWADAADWQRRLDRIEVALDAAARNARPVAIASTTDLQAGPLPFQSSDAWRPRLAGFMPNPWEPDAQELELWAAELTETAFETFWLSDGLSRESREFMLSALEEKGVVKVFESSDSAIGLRPAQFENGIVLLNAVRSKTADASEAEVVAIGPDPAGIERELARATLSFDKGAGVAETKLSLPPELRNRISRFEIAGVRSAAAKSLTDDSLKRREVALIAGRDDREGLELLSPTHYLEQALRPTADLVGGSLADIMLANPDVIILADVATLAGAESESIAEWVDQGGLLVRFAGQRLAGSDIGRETEDLLMPVRLRAGGRNVGGAMSWGQPKSLRAFSDTSPFHGLVIPEEVKVTAQVMAQPDPDLADRVIAALADGTPLVTRKRLGQGQVVLFHVTANAEWSTLPLSGLFVQMLERLAVSTRPARPDASELVGTTWVPEEVLDAFGEIQDAENLAGVSGETLAENQIGRAMLPGLYTGEDRRIAANVIGPETTLGPAVWPARIPVEGLGVVPETALKAWLLVAALALLAIDVVASLWLVGRLTGMRSALVPAVAALLIYPNEGTAQNDDFALNATSEVALAFVLTGDVAVDRVAEAGLRGLSDVLFARTSIEPSNPIAVNLEIDELSFFPFLYWPVTPDQPQPSADAYAKLNRYLRTGGMILFDTRDADVARFGTSSPNGQKLQQLARPLDIPPLEPIPKDHVLTRTFYLLQAFPGRHLSQDVWVEAAPPDAKLVEGMPFRNLNDNVTPVVIGGNDWAAAWAVNDAGRAMFPVGRGLAGERQREIAYRFGVNLMMHVLTGNYKSDQVHVPALLDRLGQ